ncbi:MAG: RNA methyltransferase [Candidatus Promineifilaceae bacterium]|nr:RNA methyltransferase [Candidatus Promineifilaceae bacterium]
MQRHRRYRDGRGAFFIEGVRNFVQVVDRDVDIVVIVYSEKLLTAAVARKLVRQRRRAGVTTLRISPEQFRAISQTRRASGISAVVRQRWRRLDDVVPDAGLCWIILSQVRWPGNLGTLIRTSEAVGGAGFILLDNSVDAYAPGAVRASMGAHFSQTFVRTDQQALRNWVEDNGLYVIGASPDGARKFHEISYPCPSLILLGEERHGLTAPQRSLCQDLVRIPMVGNFDSLNLGVAGSLLLYEVFRAHNG